jgi:hypothetical protein
VTRTVRAHQSGDMELSDRDGAVVRWVGGFSQLSGSHIRELAFHDRSQTPLDRALKRLVKAKYLARVGRRSSGDRAGSGAYVYQLGPRGWSYVHRKGSYWPYRAISHHALKVADVYLDVAKADRAGVLQVLRYALEWPVGNARADLVLEIGVEATRKVRNYFVEVDLATERPRRIEEKCVAYYRAFTSSTAAVFPYVLFVVPDEYRRQEIHRVIARQPAEAQALFKVCLFSDVIEEVTS